MSENGKEWTIFADYLPQVHCSMEMNNGQNDVMDCLKRVKNIEGFDPTCRTYVMKRQLEESKGTQVFVLHITVGLDTAKPDSAACKQRCRPACTSTQSYQCLCYSLSVNYSSPTSCMHNFNILASLCS